MKHTDIKKLFAESESFVGTSPVICGWVRTARDSKNVSFLEVNDGSCFRSLQLVIDKEKMDESVYRDAMAVGASLTATGTIVASDRNGIEMNVETLTVLGKCPSDYPLQKKRHTLEYLRTIPHLRVRARYFEAVFAVRDQLAQSIHQYFHKNGYRYVHPPIITGSDCEGAGEMFRVTTLPWNATAESEAEYYANDFFGRKAGLTVSAQLEGEMAAMGLGRIYTFGPTFRAENSNTTRHAAEFWMIEPEIAFADLQDDMRLAEDMIKYIISYVLEHAPEEMEFFNSFMDKGLLDRLNNVLSNDFGHITYTEAVELLAQHNDQFEYPVSWGCDLQTEHERYLTEVVFKKPVFVTDYPKEIKAFYMKLNPDGKTVAAMDCLVPGIGEIIGGSQREDNYEVLKARIEELGMKPEDYGFYMDLRKYGSARHAGFGLGFERMVMYMTGIGNIRDAIPFPRTVGNCEL